MFTIHIKIWLNIAIGWVMHVIMVQPTWHHFLSLPEWCTLLTFLCFWQYHPYIFNVLILVYLVLLCGTNI